MKHSNNKNSAKLTRQALAFLLALVLMTSTFVPGISARATQVSGQSIWSLSGTSPTEAPTDPSTEAPTEPSTEAPTEPSTEAPTEPSTEATTEPAGTTENTDSSEKPCSTCGQTQCICDLTTVYLRNGAIIYKDYQNTAGDSKTIDKWNTSIKVKENITDEAGNVWLKFVYSNVLAELLNGYHYVRVADTTFAQCTCAQAPAADGDHEVGCALVPMTSTGPQKSAYEQAMEDLKAFEEEAKHLADELDKNAEDYIEKLTEKCNDLYDRLYALIDEAQIQWEEQDAFTTDEMMELINRAENLVDYLYEVYRYDGGVIEPLAEESFSNKALDTATRAESGITFELFNYDKNINFTSPQRTATRSFATHFAFHGSQSKYKDYYSDDTGIGSVSHETAHMHRTGRLLYKMNLSETGYPVLGTCSDGNSGDSDTTKHTINASVGYLFGEGNDHAVTAYRDITNTPLTYNAATGYYEYSSAKNAADLSTDGKKIYVREYQERASESANNNKNAVNNFADFFPFNSIVGRDTDNDGTTEKPVYGETGNTAYHYTGDPNKLDLWFGARMHATFYTPKDSKVNGQNMVYEFSGDDDVMVYIDNIFVLDLGGAHGQCSGAIDFNTGLVEVWYDTDGDERDKAAAGDKTVRYYPSTIYERYKLAYKEQGITDEAKLTAKLATVFDPVLDENGNQLTVKDAWGNSYPQYRFKDYTNHTFDWFYMERYGSLANFNTKFNLPTLPENSLTVEKDVKFGPSDEEFRFQANFKNGENQPLSQVTYLDENGREGTMKLDSTGTAVFTMSHGQKRTFQLAANYHYSVTELDADQNGYITTKSGSAESAQLDDANAVYILYTNELVPGKVETDKTVSEDTTLGDYILKLEGYATGEITEVNEVVPADIVVVFDQSGSMVAPQNPDAATLTKAMMENDPIHKKNAENPLYYYAVGKYTNAFVFFYDGVWMLYDTGTYIGPDNDNDKVPDSWVSGFEGWRNAIHDKATILKAAEDSLKDGGRKKIELPKFDVANGEAPGFDVEGAGGYDTPKVVPMEPGNWDTFARDGGGIFQTRYGAVYDALEEFVIDLGREETDHNVTVVGFGGANESGSAVYVGNTATQRATVMNWTDAQCEAALLSVKTEYDKLIQSINSIHVNQTVTQMGAGLEMALKVLNATKSPDRDQLVIVFSDGETISVAEAIDLANQIKGSNPNLRIYSVGTGSADKNTMSSVSSNTETDKSYYLDAQSAEQLKDAFRSIMLEVSGSINLDARTIMRDTLSTHFKLRQEILTALKGVDEDESLTVDEKEERRLEILREYIKVYTLDYLGDNNFAEKNAATGYKDVTGEVTIVTYKDGTLDVVDVTGFDYAANHVATVNGAPRGKKLVVEIPIEMSDTNLGGTHQPTNVDEKSGIYKGDNVWDFDLPHADTPATVTIKKVVAGNLGDRSQEFDFKVEGVQYYDTNKSAADSYNSTTHIDKMSGHSNYLVALGDLNSEAFTNSNNSLKHGDSLVLDNIKEGVWVDATTTYYTTLTITEPNLPDGYKLTVTDADGNALNGTPVTRENAAGETELIGIQVAVKPGMEIIFTNTKNVTIDTGISLDSIPYIVILVGVVAVAGFLFLRKRRDEE